MKFLFIVSIFLLFPAIAQAQVSVDIGFQSREDIFFSTDTLVAGDRVRVYARVTNFGTEDVTGYVAFNQGTIALGNTQVISVRSDGAQEEVFVDFTVPESAFNVRAEIVSTDLLDENIENNIIISNLFDPMIDEDHDGVEDEQDNCVSSANNDQADTDGDGQGNICDEDDDEDTLTDELEEEMGTDALVADSDADGFLDAEDIAPTDPAKGEKEVIIPARTESAFVKNETEPVQVKTDTDEQEPDEDVEESASEIIIRPSGLAYKQLDWKTYYFEMRDIPEDAMVRWDFGDGATSTRSSVNHIFRNSGSYTVTTTVSYKDASISTDSVEIPISFFHWQNPAVKLIISMLLVFLIVGFSILFRLKRLHEQERL